MNPFKIERIYISMTLVLGLVNPKLRRHFKSYFDNNKEDYDPMLFNLQIHFCHILQQIHIILKTSAVLFSLPDQLI